MSDLEQDYNALRNAVGAVWLRRDVVRAAGPEAEMFLQGQLSQDIAALKPGSSAWSWVLQPHGKVDAFVRVTRVEPNEFLVDVDGGASDALLERLNRFKLRTKIDIEAVPWKVLGLRGPKSRTVDVAGGAVANADWADVEGVDIIGADVDVPSGVQLCEYDAYDALRIEGGMPQMGSELDEMTIPTEAGINDRTVSFTKGCYTGQELVARIDSRGGNVPRHLRSIIIESDEVPPRGAKIMPVAKTGSGVKPLGVLTSVAYSPRIGSPVGLAMIRRDALPPVDAALSWDDGPTPCRVEKLPLS